MDDGSDDRRKALQLADGTQLEVAATSGGAHLILRQSDGLPRLEIDISLTPQGPVIRARAAALDIEVAHDLVARCDTFRVEASRAIELVSGGNLQARANDDVQLLGEQILLNTERQKELPAWINATPVVAETVVPASDRSGDAELLSTLEGDD